MMQSPHSATTKRLLVVGPAWIGDMVMAQTLFKYIKTIEPTTCIDVLAPGWTLPLVERMPEVAQSIVFPLGHGELNLKVRRRIAKDLTAHNYDQAIILPSSFKSALTPYWAKIPKRTGWLGEWRYGLLNDARRLRKDELPLMIQRFVALGLEAGAPLPANLDHYWPTLSVDQGLREEVLKRLGLVPDKPILALCPGAEYGPAKRWPTEYFTQVAQAKINEGWQVFIFGSSKEEHLAQEIVAHTHADCHNLCGKTTLVEALELLALANVVVSNDSGLMHIAAALQRPLVVIYGSSSPTFTPPLAKKVAIVKASIECSPCYKRVCPLEHFNCMKQSTPDNVLAKINMLCHD